MVMRDVEILPPGSFRLDRHISELEGVIERVLGGVTDEKIDKASLRDVAIAYGVLIDKKQLLEGKPTQILSVEERQELSDLLPALLREAERRGILVSKSPSIETTVSQAPQDGRKTKRLRKV